MIPLPFLPTGQIASRTYYEATRLRTMDSWWHWLVLVSVILAVAVFVVALYRRDGVELRKPTQSALLFLRLAALAGVLLFFIHIERKSEQRLVKDSRVVVLVDTSQSMGLTDEVDDAADSRIGSVANFLSGDFLDSIRKSHDVVVYSFDQHDQPAEVAALARTVPLADLQSTVDPTIEAQTTASRIRWLTWTSRLFFIAAIAAVLAHLFFGRVVRNEDGESWALLITIVCLVVSVTLFGVRQLRYPDEPSTGGTTAVADGSDLDRAPVEGTSDQGPVHWQQLLRPQGTETRLGDAIEYIVSKERGGPIAGITIFTDGNINAGVDYRSAVASAADAAIPVNLIGLGSDRRPVNVRVVDMESPRRVYPGDLFRIRGFVQSQGLQGRSATVRLLKRSAADRNATPTVEDEKSVALAADGVLQPVEFDVNTDQIGNWKYSVTVSGIADDTDTRDNQSSTDVQVVDRKNRVLLLAGGPTREYRFVRTLCYRDKDTIVDVLLQSSSTGAAQESDRVLVDFPTTPEELFEYDCVVAFDPDWEALDDAQIELLDRWVADKSGGLIVIAGAVYTPEWTTLRHDRPSTKTLKGLYPVTFYSRAVMRLARGDIATELAPLQLTADAAQQRSLWLEDSALSSEQAWAQFDGFYSVFPVRGIKPGAVLYAHLANGNSDSPAVALAEQFYGSGRVLYVGSGEFWRLRMYESAYFDRLYTQLIRHVSQGRLLRDSSRGLLSVSNDRCYLGETITVRATMTDAQYRPLRDPKLAAELIQPKGDRVPLPLMAIQDAQRDGTYVGQFTSTQEGDYEVELVVPQADDLQILTASVKVRVPELEIKAPQRNDAIMNEVAIGTGGNYFPSIEEVHREMPRLLESLVPQDQETYLPGTPDRKFQQRLMGWLMALICGTLSLEWLVRRLNRLA